MDYLNGVADALDGLADHLGEIEDELAEDDDGEEPDWILRLNCGLSRRQPITL
jgi:hypothetical protein